MKSDGNKCRDCGSILRFVYAIDQYADKYGLENLETLCQDCDKLKRQFGGSGIIAPFAWMFQHLTGMPRRRYFEYSTIGRNILYDIINMMQTKWVTRPVNDRFLLN